MNIFLNGAPTEVEDRLGMSELIRKLSLADRRIAVEVNGELVPRSRFDIHCLEPDDRVEIIHAVGGG